MAGFMTHVICRLTAKNRDQLRNPTLGSRVRATFTVFTWVIGLHEQRAVHVVVSAWLPHQQPAQRVHSFGDVSPLVQQSCSHHLQPASTIIAAALHVA